MRTTGWWHLVILQGAGQKEKTFSKIQGHVGDVRWYWAPLSWEGYNPPTRLQVPINPLQAQAPPHPMLSVPQASLPNQGLHRILADPG